MHPSRSHPDDSPENENSQRSGSFFHQDKSDGIELSIIEDATAPREETPLGFFIEQLLTRDGAKWFELSTSRASESLGRPDGLVAHKGDREFLLSVKKEGKERLQQAQNSDRVSPTTLSEAVALYFGAVTLLLAHPETKQLQSISSISTEDMRSTLQVMRRVLNSPWQDVIDAGFALLD